MSSKRRSLACDGLGLPAPDMLLLEAHDCEYFCDGSAAAEWDEPLALDDESVIPVSAPIDSDDEDNLDQSAADQSIPTPLATAPEAAAKRVREASTVDDVSARIVEGRNCQN